MLFKKVVAAVQVAALVAVFVSVVFLFTKEPPSSTTTAAAAPQTEGQRLFVENCASCHGANGQGATAPQLAGRVVQQYPNVADQVAVVDDGKGTMPGFKDKLSKEQIAQIVGFTRGSESGSDGAPAAAASIDAKQLYIDQCAACHGDFGEGTYAPPFKGGLMLQKFPDKAAEMKVVVDGIPPSMKAFGDKLTPAQIEAVVEYTRNL